MGEFTESAILFMAGYLKVEGKDYLLLDNLNKYIHNSNRTWNSGSLEMIT